MRAVILTVIFQVLLCVLGCELPEEKRRHRENETDITFTVENALHGLRVSQESGCRFTRLLDYHAVPYGLNDDYRYLYPPVTLGYVCHEFGLEGSKNRTAARALYADFQMENLVNRDNESDYVRTGRMRLFGGKLWPLYPGRVPGCGGWYSGINGGVQFGGIDLPDEKGYFGGVLIIGKLLYHDPGESFFFDMSLIGVLPTCIVDLAYPKEDMFGHPDSFGVSVEIGFGVYF